MEEEILADFFDWKGKHSLIRLSVLVIKTNPAGICTIIPNSSFLIPHSILICRQGGKPLVCRFRLKGETATAQIIDLRRGTVRDKSEFATRTEQLRIDKR